MVDRLAPLRFMAMLGLVSCSATRDPQPQSTPAPGEALTPTEPTAPEAPSPVGDPAVVTNPELATTDLLTVEGFVGTEASILGLRLGQTWDEAKAIVDAHPELVFDLDEGNPGRFYVKDAGGGPGDDALFYCQWPDGRATMGRLVIYSRAKRFLPEGTARLLDMPSLAQAPAAVAGWLGKPDRSVVTLDIPSIGLQLNTHVFERRALEVIDYTSSGEPPKVIIALVVPEVLVRAAE